MLALILRLPARLVRRRGELAVQSQPTDAAAASLEQLVKAMIRDAAPHGRLADAERPRRAHHHVVVRTQGGLYALAFASSCLEHRRRISHPAAPTTFATLAQGDDSA